MVFQQKSKPLPFLPSSMALPSYRYHERLPSPSPHSGAQDY
jgi:hypothetical protein